MKYGFLFIFILIWILSCNQHSSPSIKYPSFVDSSKDNIWGADVNLWIQKAQRIDGNTLYTLKSFYDRDSVGFQILFPTKADTSVWGSGLEIRSLGKISKNFRNVLARLYKLKIDTSKDFPIKISLSFTNLDKFTKSTLHLTATDGNGFHSYKLFFEDAKESEDGEAELFLNINETDELVELREKDQDYRKPLIAFLSE